MDIKLILNAKWNNFNGAALINANFRHARLYKANFNDANIEGADFESANLEKVQIITKNAEKADFICANLTEADLRYASLDRSSFRGANLKNAHFSNASLKGVYFNGANLEGANFENANLEGADFNKRNYIGHRLDGALIERKSLEKKQPLNTRPICAQQLIEAKNIYGIVNIPENVIEDLKKYGCEKMLKERPEDWGNEFKRYRAEIIWKWNSTWSGDSGGIINLVTPID